MEVDPLIFQDHNAHNHNLESVSIEIISSPQDTFHPLSSTSHIGLYSDSLIQSTLPTCSSDTLDPQFVGRSSVWVQGGHIS